MYNGICLLLSRGQSHEVTRGDFQVELGPFWAEKQVSAGLTIIVHLISACFWRAEGISYDLPMKVLM